MGHQQNSSAKYKAIIILFGMEKGMERREIPARKKSHERNSRIAITTQTIQLEQIVAEHFLWLETYCSAKIRSWCVYNKEELLVNYPAFKIE